MGKTAKKNHQQHRTRERLDIDVTPETPEQIYARIYKGVRVLCPACGIKIDLKPLAGGPYPFRCPSCGCELAEARYDARARELEHANDEAKVVIDAAKSLEAQVEQAGLLRRLYLKARLALGRRKLEGTREQFKNGRALMARLAEGRYYASQWYRATGVRRDFFPDAKPDERYRLKPCCIDGAFVVVPADDRPLSRGIVGEWRVFEALRQRCEDPKSPLYGSRLAANLFLPVASRSLPRRSGTPAPLWRQVDTVLFTEVGAFVFEVKSKRAKVKVHKRFSSIDACDRKGKFRSETWMLRQCAMHADSLEEVVDGLTLDDVYEVSDFVEPLAFETAEPDFSEGNVYVGALGCGGVESFVAIIERKVAVLRKQGVDVMSAERCEELARDLAVRYGDLERGKMHRHVERLKQISSGGVGPCGRQVFTSGSMCR